jgi:hypothetical protein
MWQLVWNHTFWDFLSLLIALTAVFFFGKFAKDCSVAFVGYLRMRRAASFMRIQDRGLVTTQNSCPVYHNVCGSRVRVGIGADGKSVRYCHLCFARVRIDGLEVPLLAAPEKPEATNVLTFGVRPKNATKKVTATPGGPIPPSVA